MIDAYTIGITLALEDGVSEGIAAIRRDLAALDVAVADSAARLLILRKLAAGLAVPKPAAQIAQTALFAPAVARPQTVLAPVATTTDVPTPAPGSPPAPTSPLASSIAVSLAPTQAPAVAPQASPSAPVATPATAHPTALPHEPSPIPAQASAPIVPAATPVQTAKSAPAAQIVQQSAAQRLPVWAPHPSGAQSPDFTALARLLTPRASVPSTVPLPQRDPPSVQLAPPEPPSPISSTAPITVPSSPGPLRMEPSVRAPAPAILSDSRPPTAPSPSLPQWSAPREHEGRSRPAVPPISMQTPSNSSTAPWRTPVSVPPIQADPRAPVLKAAEQTQPIASTGSTDTQQASQTPAADVHLDGTVLGRWVTRYLEREVNRPPAGATAFDPRMSPSWSGAPIGN